MWWRRLNSRSFETALTMSWQSSNTPSIAMLWMLASCRLNICACWNGLMRPCGREHEDAARRCLPRIAYSAALPVSPEVAPRMFSVSPRRASSYSNRLPSSCIAMSLKASVGPLDRASSHRPVAERLQRRDLAACRRPRRCRSCRPARAGRRRDVVDVERQDLERQVGVATGRASAPAWPRRPAGSAPAGTGRRRAPGLRAGSRRSARGVLSPRVLMYFNSALPCGCARSARARSAAPASARSPCSSRPRRCRGSG